MHEQRRHARAAAGSDTRLAGAYLLVVVPTIVVSESIPGNVVGRNIVYGLVGVSVVAAIIFGVHRYQPRARVAWLVLAWGQALWVLADTTFNWQQDVLHVTTFPTVSDAFYLAGYPLFAIGFALLIKGRTGLRRDLGPALDSAIVTVGLGLLSWVTLTRPAIEGASGSAIATAVAVAYPVMDVILLGALIRLLESSGGRSPAFRFLLASLTLLIVADTTSTAFGLFTANAVGSVQALWMLSYAALGAAALHPSMTELSEPRPVKDIHFSGFRLVAVVAATMIAPAILAAQQAMGLRLDTWAVAAGSAAMVLLVVMRMKLAIARIASVHESLETLQHDLALQAARDPLTSLANRTRTLQLLAGAIGRSKRTRATVGLLFIDLDGFKEINDTYGHRAGDEVLRQVALRMQQQVRSTDFLGRLGGDEFLLGIDDLPDRTAAVALAERLVATVAEPIPLDDGGDAVVVQVGASVGIALGAAGETDLETLLHEADLATYQAKAAGRGCVVLFSDSARAALKERHQIELALAAAIRRDELVLHYQAIVDLQTGGVDCYEALVRWNRPGTGLIQPDEFLPIAESSGLIVDLDLWVLRAAIAQLAEWNIERGDRDLMVSVNISAKHVSMRRILADVAGALQAAEVDAHQIVLEVTETALMDGNLAAAHLEELRRIGVLVSLDDFGTGYQSSAQLSRLPVDVVKIDRQFLDTHSEGARVLLELMVKAAHVFGLRVVAEGIEDEQQLALARHLGCEFAQGYYFGRPAPAIRTRPDHVRAAV